MRTCMNSDTPLAGGVVGAAGFEPTTFCAQGRRATRLRYAPPQGLLGAGFLPAAETARKRKFHARVGHVRSNARGRPPRTGAFDQCPGQCAKSLLTAADDRFL